MGHDEAGTIEQADGERVVDLLARHILRAKARDQADLGIEFAAWILQPAERSEVPDDLAFIVEETKHDGELDDHIVLG